MKKQFAIIAMTLVCAIAFAQHDHAAHAGHDQSKNNPSFQDGKLGSAFGHYIRLKDALVASDKDAAKKAAGELQKSLASIDAGKKLAEQAAKIGASTDIEEQRKLFSPLSSDMVTLVKGTKLSAGSVYIAYCPMANNNEGAFWLSNDKQIKNPYFGDAMLTCGSVKETLQ